MEQALQSMSHHTQQGLSPPVTHPQSLTPRSSRVMAGVQLDADQLAVLNCWNNPKTIIIAGPGSGKTTTLCELIVHILQKQPGKRILALAYNVYASNVLHERLQARSVTLQEKRSAFGSDPKPGCLVITFDSFGFWSSGAQSLPAEETYRQSLEKSVSRLQTMDVSGTARKWDWVIVDEAQDLNDTHALLVETLRETSSHLVVAGDLCQEVYSGARWFSKQFGDTEEINIKFLRNNYRSTPQIVEVLNRYRRHHFPGSVQFDLISKREDCHESSVEFWQGNPRDYQETIGNRLSLSEPKDAYGITPVSVDAFQNEHVTNAVRQILFEKRPLANTFVYGKSELLSCGQTNVDGYVLGTPFGLKGTERSRVVLYGLTSPYKVINPDALKRLIFVAMSRARDHLHIIANGQIPADSPLCCLSRLECKVPGRDQFPRNTRDFKVTQLAKNEYVWRKPQSAQGEVIKKLPSVSVDAVDDHDIVGSYLGNVIADSLGVLPSFCIQVDQTFQPNPWESSRPHNGVMKVPADCPNLQELQHIVSTANVCYSHTVVPISVDIGRIWKKSSRLERELSKHRDACKPYVEYITNELLHSQGSNDRPRPQEECSLPIKLHGSRIDVGNITTCADLKNHAGIVDIKYASNITRTHRTQTAMTAAILNAPAAYVINLQGQIEKVTPVSREELVDMAWAKMVLDAVKTCPKRQTCRMPRSCSCYIAVYVLREIERKIEVGAVAFSVDGDLRGTYHRVLQGVSLSPNTSDIIISDRQLLEEDQEPSVKDFGDWVQRVSGLRCFICWGDRPRVVNDLGLRQHGMTYDLQSRARPHVMNVDDEETGDTDEDTDGDDNEDDEDTDGDDNEDDEDTDGDDNEDDEDNAVASTPNNPTLKACLEKIFKPNELDLSPKRALENAVAIAAISVALCKT